MIKILDQHFEETKCKRKRVYKNIRRENVRKKNSYMNKRNNFKYNKIQF